MALLTHISRRLTSFFGSYCTYSSTSGDGLSVDNLVDVILVVLHRNMHRIRITEKIVHIAQYLLISPYQEHTYIIMFACLDFVQGQIVRLLVMVDVCGNLTVAVATDVLQRCAPCRLLVEPLDGG